MWIHGFLSGGPASSSSTRYLPLSLSRAATGQPAEPAPVTIKSYISTEGATSSPLLTADAEGDDSQSRDHREDRRCFQKRWSPSIATSPASPFMAACCSPAPRSSR